MFKWYIIRDPTVCDSMETVGYAGCSCCFKNDVDMLALVACHLTTAAVAALPELMRTHRFPVSYTHLTLPTKA